MQGDVETVALRPLQAELIDEIMTHDQEIAGAGFVERCLRRKETLDRLEAIIARERAAALSAATPGIEARVREACAVIADACDASFEPWQRDDWESGYATAQHEIAEAIRKG